MWGEKAIESHNYKLPRRTKGKRQKSGEPTGGVETSLQDVDLQAPNFILEATPPPKQSARDEIHFLSIGVFHPSISVHYGFAFAPVSRDKIN